MAIIGNMMAYKAYLSQAKSMQALDKLKCCEVHSTVILSSVDDGVFKRLGMRLTCEPVYEKNSLYHK